MSDLVERIEAFTTKEHLVDHPENYEKGHPFSKISLSGLEVAIKKRYQPLRLRVIDGPNSGWDTVYQPLPELL